MTHVQRPTTVNILIHSNSEHKKQIEVSKEGREKNYFKKAPHQHNIICTTMDQNLKSHKLRTRPVKHTLTSLLRMVKVNPLLAQGDGSSIKDKLPLEKIQRSQSLKLPSRSKPMVSSGVAASSTMKNFHNNGKRNNARTFENKAKITSKPQTTKVNKIFLFNYYLLIMQHFTGYRDK